MKNNNLFLAFRKRRRALNIDNCLLIIEEITLKIDY